MERAFLQFVLFSKSNVKSVLDYCKDRDICSRQKDTVARKILKLSGYKIPEIPEVSPIFVVQDLLELSLKLKEKDEKNPLAPTEEFKKIIGNKGDIQTRALFAYNDIPLPKNSLLDNIKGISARLLQNDDLRLKLASLAKDTITKTATKAFSSSKESPKPKAKPKSKTKSESKSKPKKK
jgi:hypothetical protein